MKTNKTIEELSRVEKLMIHIPDNKEHLRKIIKTLAVELEAVNSVAFTSVYEAYVGKRKDPEQAKRLKKALLKEDVFLIPSVAVCNRFTRDFQTWQSNFPEYGSTIAAIVEVIKSFGSNVFTVRDVMKRLNEKYGVIVRFRKDGFKRICYRILDDAGYTRVMRHCAIEKKLVARFSLPYIDVSKSIV